MKLGNVEATGGFFLLMAWLNYLDRQMILPLALAACMLHELGHYAAIIVMGGTVKQIRLTAVGAEMVMAHPMNYWQEGTAALAGPAVNLLLARLFCGWEPGILFSGLNLVLGCFNLLPVRCLDGGRALHCALCLVAGPDAAEWAGEWLSRGCSALILAGGILLFGDGGTITLLCIGLWLFILEFSHQKGEK